MEEQKSIASNFFVALSEKVEALKHNGEKFSLTKFTPLPGNNLQIGVVAHGKEKIFSLSFTHELFFLDNVEAKKVDGRPVFYKDDMVSYVLILANGGQIPGKLLMPGYDKRMRHLEAVVPT